METTSHDGGSREGKVAKDNSTATEEDGGSGSGYRNCKDEAKPRFSDEGNLDDQDERCRRSERAEERGHQLVRNMDGDDHHHHAENIPLASSHEKWYSVDPSGILDQSCSSSQWLDFWT